VFPNPARNMVNIECIGAKEILIVDYLGKTISNEKVINSQNATINVQGFAKGVYLVKAIMINGEIKTEKLIVE
jgi:phosphoribosylaminoimidazole (AIR) synthetase